MAVYVMFDIEVTDPTGFGEYQKVAGPIVAKYGGRFLAVGPPVVTMEGSWQPQAAGVIEFPSLDLARQWYDAPEYQEPKQLRHKTAKTNMVLVEGLPVPTAL
jgi:uncharacterized protein (DUF1330 family)